MTADTLLLPILIPIATGLLILFIPKALRWAIATLSLLATGSALTAAILIFRNAPPPFQLELLRIGRIFLSADLRTTEFSSLMLLLATGFGFLISIYSLAYMTRHYKGKQFYAFMLFAIGGAAGVLLADHLLFFLIAWEIVTVSLYFLISTGGEDSRKGATKTFAMLGGADACLLLGIALLWQSTGTFSISAINVSIDGWLPGIAFFLMALGALTKAGGMPLHSWIPAASEAAPLSVMALLPGAIDKLLGIYLLIILTTGMFVITTSLSLVLMIMGALTIIAAVLLALVQHDLKKLLSYHAISQVGYMVLGIGTLTPIGILGGVFHMINNTIYKSCLFLGAGSIEKRSGTTDLGKLGGLGRTMPFTFFAMFVAALAISGVPPLNGFVSKWLIYQGVIDTGMRGSFVFLTAAMFGSALTLASFVKVIYSVFLGEKTKLARDVKNDAPFPMVFPLMILAFACVLFGVYYPLPVNTLLASALGSIQIQGVWNSGTASVLIVVGMAIGMLIYLIGRTGRKTRTVSPFIGGEHLNEESGKVVGTHFYNTIRDFPLLRRIYDSQEKDHLDPYTWLGGLGLALNRFLKYLHNGLLSWYMSWSVFGMAALIILFILLL